MSNYLRNSKLVKSNSQFEFYSFTLVDDLYELLKSNSNNQIEFDFGHNIIRIPNDKDSVFSLSIEKSNLDQELISDDKNNNIFNNLGKLKDRITVKENYQLKTSDTLKRKLETNNFFDKHSPAKKPLIDSNLDNDDDLGSRLSTRPKVPRPFPMKTKISILDELKLGKSIKQISNLFNISENKIKEFQSKENDIRKQYQESFVEHKESIKSLPLPQQQFNKQNNSEKTDIKPLLKPNKSQINTSKINEKSPIESSKCVLNLDFEVKNENGKLIFGEPQKKVSVNFPAFTLQLPKNHPDIPKNNPENPKILQDIPKSEPPSALGSTKKPPIKNSTKKPSTENRISSLISRSNPTDKIYKEEPFKSINPESKKSLPNIKLKQENSNIHHHNKPEHHQPIPNKEMKVNKHYPTDPIVKNESKSSSKVIKSSTNQYEPPKDSSPFRYLVIDPGAIDFCPTENADSEIRSANFESEDFINEVQKAYNRFTVCANLYDKYRLKRLDLKNKAQEVKTDKELTELYKEFYRLTNEEKLPFYLNLEKEVIALQNKLTKAADILGLTLNQ